MTTIPEKKNLLSMLKALPTNENDVEPAVAAAVKSDMAVIAAAQAQHFDPINSPEGQLRALENTTTLYGVAKELANVTDTLPKKPRKKRSDATELNTLSLPPSSAEIEAEIELKTVPLIKLDAEDSKVFADAIIAAQADLKPIRTIFIGCLPLGKQVKFAHDFIAKASQTVENDLEIHHVLLAPYSTGGASLAAQLRSDILALGESDFDLVLMNRSPEGRAIEQVLVSLAKNVVVGI